MTVDAGLRVIFKQYLPQFDWATIEVGAIGRGVPDANYCYEGVEGWIEYKSAEHWRAKVRPEQVGWSERRISHGGRVFVAVRRAKTELWLYHGSELRRLKDERLDAVPALGHWTGGPGRWDWRKIGATLLFKNIC
jgi:hypothetical protein